MKCMERYILYMKLSLQRTVFDPVWSKIFAKLFHHGGFVIGPVADVHGGLRVIFEDDEVGADPMVNFTLRQKRQQSK